MGIGNRSSLPSSACQSVRSPEAPASTISPGGRKVGVIERTLQVRRLDPTQPLEMLTAVGGLEIAALVGVVLGAAARRIVVVVVDGLIATAAALVAADLCPAVRGIPRGSPSLR
jgi:nicotinate-nucleotide--dimethylbenzimidazole phosphoribosyltransferase